MNIFKYFAGVLVSVAFLCTVFAGDQIGQRQHSIRLSTITQDCRNQNLTPEEARNIACRLAKMPSKHSKPISITADNIMSLNEMPKGVIQEISKGAYINAVYADGNTALHYICSAQNIILALEFMKWGAKLLPNKEGWYPQDYISNTHAEWSCGNNKKDCTVQDLKVVRTHLVNEALKYNVSSFGKSFPAKQKRNRK